MKTTMIAMLMFSGSVTIAASAGAALPSRETLRPMPRPVAGLPAPSPSRDAGGLALFATVDIARLPVMDERGTAAIVPFAVVPRAPMGYPYLAQLSVDGSIMMQRLIRTRETVILEAAVRPDGVTREACVRVLSLRDGAESVVVGERCFDVSVGPTR